MALFSGAATWWVAGPPASYPILVAALYAVMATVLWLRLPHEAPGPGIGLANRVTLARASLAVPVVGLAAYPTTLEPAVLWWVIALSTLVLLLDAVDGRVARRSGSQTSFGGRFDMEVDAAFLLGLSVLVWQSGKVGAWVMLIGSMRYLFVVAGWIRPALAVELPPSRRRQAVCVVQGVVLLVALGPIIPVWAAVVVSAAGLASLTYSFAVDVRWSLSSTAAHRSGAVASDAGARVNTRSR